MEDHNSPEAVAARANQEDPIVMYLIVRESLGMSIGKTAAQCAHASQMLQLRYDELSNRLAAIADASYRDSSEEDEAEYSLNFPRCMLFEDWLKSSFRKVVLRADDKEWKKVKDEFSQHQRVVVVDAGLTEIASGSETVIGLWPMYKSNVPKVVKKLQVLK